ncbi:hypothetical protein C2G38_2115625, partial [Gigaspora rosea]
MIGLHVPLFSNVFILLNYLYSTILCVEFDLKAHLLAILLPSHFENLACSSLFLIHLVIGFMQMA